MTVGYIGLGNMGGALARRLAPAGDLLVFDRSAAAVSALVEAGATAADDVAALAERCDTILLCLPTSEHVHSVLFGEGGLAGVLKPGTLVVDQTTGDPTATRTMAEELAATGAELIDAPVSGGPTGAAAGTIAIMVGASEAQFGRVKPVLEGISPRIFHAGAVGAGHTVKLVNNMLSAAQRFLSFEAVSLAAKSGLDPRTVVEILVASGGRNSYLERIMIPQVLEGRLNIGFTLGLCHKDVRLACELGSEVGVPLLYGNLTRDLLIAGLNEYGAEAQVDVSARMFDRAADTHLVPASADES